MLRTACTPYCLALGHGLLDSRSQPSGGSSAHRGALHGAQIIFELVEVAGNVPDSAQYGVAKNLFQTPAFWLACVLTALVGFGHRFVERGFVWLFRPQARLVLWPLGCGTSLCTNVTSVIS